MQIWRHNSYSEIHGAPDWFLGYLRDHLSIPVMPGTQPGERFGSIQVRECDFYGSLLNVNRVPAGLTQHVVSLADYYTRSGYPVSAEVRDCRQRPAAEEAWQCIGMEPRRYQDRVHALIMREGVGVIDAPPRSGKTLMAAMAVDRIAQPVVYLAPSLSIVRQTWERFCDWFGDDAVARLDGNATPQQKDITKPIVIATPQSAVKQSREWWDARGMLVIDEFHHAAAETYHRINALAENVYYRLCFTGTHWRTGDDGLAMNAICSRVLYQIDPAYLIRNGYLAQPFVHFVKAQGPTLKAKDWREAYDLGIAKCEWRNQLVAQTANALVGSGEPTIVLVKRREQADYLGSMIHGAAVAKGGEAALTSDSLKQFIAGDLPCIVGTTVLGEGVDLPNASALVYASGGAASVQTMQSYFRPLTAHKGKQWGRVYDFADQHHHTLQRHAQARRALIRRVLPGHVYE